MKISQQGRRPTRHITWWVASFVLVCVGVVLLIMGLRGPDVGPNLPAPVGNTSMRPSLPDLSNAGNSWPFASPDSANRDVAGTTAVVDSSLASPSAVIPVRLAADVTTDGVSVTPVGGPRTPHVATLNVERSIPTELSIPSIGVSTSVSQVGLNKDGSVQSPKSWRQAAWYKYDVTPGEIGSAVILGHVDSTAGPAVFYRIAHLKMGSSVMVTLADHKVLTFKVIGIREYSKSNFPDKLVYGARSYSALQLVTCGGVFDSKTHHYLSNIVAYTRLFKISLH